MEGGDGGDAEGQGAVGGGGGERERGGDAGGERAQEGGVDPGEAGGEEARRDRGAVERAVAPPARRGEAAGVVLVEVRQEVGLAAGGEFVHRDQALHGSPVAASTRAMPSRCFTVALASPSNLLPHWSFGLRFPLEKERETRQTGAPNRKVNC